MKHDEDFIEQKLNDLHMYTSGEYLHSVHLNLILGAVNEELKELRKMVKDQDLQIAILDEVIAELKEELDDVKIKTGTKTYPY